ncbi:MAG: DNA repair protein RecO [Candidatus Binatia bacterium]
MRVSHATPAIVLRSWPFGESDRIVSFLTESHGKLTGIAKGAKRSKKRFVNSLEPFSFVNLRFQDGVHSSLAFILGCELQKSYKNLIASLDKIAVAFYCVEITEGLIAEREENRLIFKHLKQSLSYLENQETSLIFLIGFELKLLRLAGYQPFLETCRRCGVKRPRLPDPIPTSRMRWYFSLRDGGILCESCSGLRKETLPMSGEALDLMMDLQQEQNLQSRNLTLPVLKQMRAVVLRFIQFQMDKEIKSASFLYQFSS